jgi:cytochrome P450
MTARTSPSRAPFFDPLSEQSHIDPYPTYSWLREHAPVYYCRKRDVWVLSRYEDVRAALRDWTTFTSTGGVELADYVGFFGAGNFLEMDPPRHDVLRKVFAPRFINKAIKSYEPMVRATAAELLEGLSGEVDLAATLTNRLPVLTICRLLGLSEDDVAWASQAAIDMMTRPPDEVGPSNTAHELRTQLVELFLREVYLRRAGAWSDDVLSDIARAVEDGTMGRNEVQGVTLLLIAAGMETTSSLMGNIAAAVASGQVDAQSLLDDTGDVRLSAIDEFLRFDSPVQWLCRVTTVGTEVRGVAIPAGARVVMLYASANRDPEVFSDPDVIDLDRDGSRNLAFGEGIHFCLGMPLAKLETRIGLGELFARYPRITATGKPHRYPSHIIRGFDSIPVRVA